MYIYICNICIYVRYSLYKKQFKFQFQLSDQSVQAEQSLLRFTEKFINRLSNKKIFCSLVTYARALQIFYNNTEKFFVFITFIKICFYADHMI